VPIENSQHVHLTVVFQTDPRVLNIFEIFLVEWDLRIKKSWLLVELTRLDVVILIVLDLKGYMSLRFECADRVLALDFLSDCVDE
jgi:hypothetical protein